MTLFVRHTRGLTLTDEGLRALEIVRPLLAQQDKTYAALNQLAQTGAQSLRLGLSTAFEQGILPPGGAAEHACGEAAYCASWFA